VNDVTFENNCVTISRQLGNIFANDIYRHAFNPIAKIKTCRKHGMDVALTGKIKTNKMTKTKLLIAAAIVSVGFTACNNENKEAKQSAETLNVYVDSVESATPVYTTENWTAIDKGYQERAAAAEKNMAALSAEEKAKADASKAKYEALKAKYELAIKEQEAKTMQPANTAAVPNFRKVLRDRLFGEGKIGDDMQFSFVNADNILSVYKNFVNTVDDNKNTFTREDWDEIKVLYEALDNRKNAVEKEGLKGADNLKIAGLKIKFAAIKSTNRIGAKVEENTESKK
jgi:hypothetical protein